MPDLPLVLVPPSKSMQPGGRGRVRPGSGSFRGLSGARREVVEALAKHLDVEPARASVVFGATGPLLDRALLAFDLRAAWQAPAMPAWERLTGVVWDHLDPASLADEARARLVVPTAVMGLSTGLDPVPEHRVGFAVTVPGIGRLDRWWRPHLTEALSRRARGHTVVDMLPHEHAAALDLDVVAQGVEMVRVQFLAAGGRAAAGHAAKAVKGVAARTVVVDGVDALAKLRWEGWRARRERDDLVTVIAP